MRAELRRSIFLACVGLLAGFALVVTLYGAGTYFKRGLRAPTGASDEGAVPLVGEREPPAGETRPPAIDAKPLASDTKPPAGDTKPPAGDTKHLPSDTKPPARSGEGAAQPQGKPRAGLEARPDSEARQEPVPDRGPSAPRTAEAPTFDIIRIEPDGEAVIAGRATPNTTVELLRDATPIARALVDPSGQFAIVPPALPTGNSEITLRVTGADGRTHVSRDSVAVVVAANRAAKPLIALTSPDKPTIVLSQPDPAVASAPVPGGPEAARSGPAKPGLAAPGGDRLAANAPGEGKTGEGKAGSARAAASPSPRTGAEPPKPGGATASADASTASPEAPASEAIAPVKIVSVEAEEGGRLYVTSQAQPGATVRLYLNDTLVAPGSAGADGRVAFTIGRGVRPGAYKIRVDQVDPVSGKVRTRSEVPFTVPAAVSRPAAKAPPEVAGMAPGSTAPARPGPAPVARPGTPEPPAPLPPAALPGAAEKGREATSKEATVARAAPGDGAGGRVGGPAPAGSPIPPAAIRAEATKSDTIQPDITKSEIAKPDTLSAPPGSVASAAPRAVPETPPAAAASAGSPTVFVPEVGTATIIRGDSLWQISRRIYGKGTRYTVIFDANQPQIRNPDLIYPGQIFVLPGGDGTAAVPQAGTRG